MIPDAVQTWFIENGNGKIISSRPVGGGCISNGTRLKTASGTTFFLKTNLNAPTDMFASEAEGLQELRAPGGVPVSGGPALPEPFLWGQDFLLLEDLNPAPRREDYWPEFGRRLAALHNHTRPLFGFHHDNYIGRTPQPNPWTESGYDFFAEQRLLFQARLAHRRGLLSREDLGRANRLAARLPDLIPAQPASLVHGDLWSGNAMTDSQGGPALIDPAAYYGWAEADLAMTALFGAFPEAFYRGYQEVHPLALDYRERFPIYNLYHNLNHLNLFGGGYLGEVTSILRRFG
jgi:fructosamine-3-kinase